MELQQKIVRKAVAGMSIDQRLAVGLSPGRLRVPEHIVAKMKELRGPIQLWHSESAEYLGSTVTLGIKHPLYNARRDPIVFFNSLVAILETRKNADGSWQRVVRYWNEEGFPVETVVPY